MKRVLVSLLAVTTLAVCSLARSPDHGMAVVHAPKTLNTSFQDQHPTAIQVDSTKPGRLTFAWFSDSKVDLAALSYDFKEIAPHVSWSAVYLKNANGDTGDFLGTAIKYSRRLNDHLYGAIGVGVKGFNLTGGQFGRLDNPRSLVFGAGLTFTYGT